MGTPKPIQNLSSRDHSHDKTELMGRRTHSHVYIQVILLTLYEITSLCTDCISLSSLYLGHWCRACISHCCSIIIIWSYSVSSSTDLSHFLRCWYLYEIYLNIRYVLMVKLCMISICGGHDDIKRHVKVPILTNNIYACLRFYIEGHRTLSKLFI